MRLFLIAVALFSRALTAFAQSAPAEPPSQVAVHCAITASSDFYAASGIAARQPGNITRMVVLPTIVLSDDVVLPFELYLSTQEVGYQQPFNQIGVNPRIGDWLTLHGGYFATRYSEFSYGDLRLLGGGFDLTPGKVRLSFVYGLARQARGADTLRLFHGEYKRTLWAGMIGYGAENEFHVHLNVVHAIDDSSSIAPDTATPAPAENLALSMSVGVPITPMIRATGEFGISGFSNDVRVDPIKGSSAFVPTWLFVPRGSTQVDAAGQLGLFVTPLPNVNVRLGARWVGPGFVTLGFAQLQNDVFDVTVAPDVRLLHNDVYARASLGMRWNNLRNNRASTTRRIIGSLSGGWSFTQNLGVDVQYSNYGMKSSHIADTVRIDNVYQLWSIAPRCSFEGWGAAHALMVSYAFQDLSDNNPKTADFTRTKSHVATLVHSMMFTSTWNATTTAFLTYVDMAAQISRIVNASETVGRSFLANNRLSASATLGYGIVNGGAGTDGQVIVRATANYAFERYGTLSCSVSNNSFNAANPTDTRPNYRELLVGFMYTLNI